MFSNALKQVLARVPDITPIAKVTLISVCTKTHHCRILVFQRLNDANGVVFCYDTLWWILSDLTVKSRMLNLRKLLIKEKRPTLNTQADSIRAKMFN